MAGRWPEALLFFASGFAFGVCFSPRCGRSRGGRVVGLMPPKERQMPLHYKRRHALRRG